MMNNYINEQDFKLENKLSCKSSNSIIDNSKSILNNIKVAIANNITSNYLLYYVEMCIPMINDLVNEYKHIACKQVLDDSDTCSLMILDLGKIYEDSRVYKFICDIYSYVKTHIINSQESSNLTALLSYMYLLSPAYSSDQTKLALEIMTFIEIRKIELVINANCVIKMPSIHILEKIFNKKCDDDTLMLHQKLSNSLLFGYIPNAILLHYNNQSDDEDEDVLSKDGNRINIILDPIKYLYNTNNDYHKDNFISSVINSADNLRLFNSILVDYIENMNIDDGIPFVKIALSYKYSGAVSTSYTTADCIVVQIELSDSQSFDTSPAVFLSIDTLNNKIYVVSTKYKDSIILSKMTIDFNPNDFDNSCFKITELVKERISKISEEKPSDIFKALSTLAGDYDDEDCDMEEYDDCDECSHNNCTEHNCCCCKHDDGCKCHETKSCQNDESHNKNMISEQTLFDDIFDLVSHDGDHNTNLTFDDYITTTKDLCIKLQQAKQIQNLISEYNKHISNGEKPSFGLLQTIADFLLND